MEIACGVIQKTKKKINVNILQKFINLDLFNIINSVTCDEFLHIIKSKKVFDIADNFIKLLIKNTHKNITDSLLMAYCIVGYNDSLFKFYKSTTDVKLINTAKNLIIIIHDSSQFNNNINLYIERIIFTFDYYLSLYNIWQSGKTLGDISKYIYELKKYIDIYNTENTNKKIKKYLEHIVKKILLPKNNFGIKAIMEHYYIFCDKNNVVHLVNYIWTNIINNAKIKYKKYQNILLVLISEVRILMVKFTNDPIEKKNLYYNIDIEDIIKNIINDTFNASSLSIVINNIIDIANSIFKNVKSYSPITHFNPSYIDKHLVKNIILTIKYIVNIIYNV